MLGDIMNFLNYEINDSSKRIVKPTLCRKKTRQLTKLDDFVGKFQARDNINCVNLKSDFKKGVL